MFQAQSRNPRMPDCHRCVIFGIAQEKKCTSGHSMAGRCRPANQSWLKYIRHFGDPASRGRGGILISTMPMLERNGCADVIRTEAWKNFSHRNRMSVRKISAKSRDGFSEQREHLYCGRDLSIKGVGIAANNSGGNSYFIS